MNFVCAGTFDNHEWVSESTITEQEEEEVMVNDLDYEICGTMVNRTLGRNLKTKKYHEAVDEAIAEAISGPFGSVHTPRTCMLASVASVFFTKHTGRMGDGRQT